jgi:hypothetical protein
VAIRGALRLLQRPQRPQRPHPGQLTCSAVLLGETPLRRHQRPQQLLSPLPKPLPHLRRHQLWSCSVGLQGPQRAHRRRPLRRPRQHPQPHLRVILTSSVDLQMPQNRRPRARPRAPRRRHRHRHRPLRNALAGLAALDGNPSSLKAMNCGSSSSTRNMRAVVGLYSIPMRVYVGGALVFGSTRE